MHNWNAFLTPLHTKHAPRKPPLPPPPTLNILEGPWVYSDPKPLLAFYNKQAAVGVLREPAR